MASGKKNYFRHSFFAHNDIKLKRFRDEIGIGFYFYYFSLLECLGTECEYESNDKFEVHFSTFRSLWGGNLKKINNILIKMDAVGLIFYENADNSFIISIPNFPKYLGKYTNKIETKSPNKRKEKKRKEKEIEVKEINSSSPLIVQDVINYLNAASNKKFRHDSPKNISIINARCNEKYNLEDFKKVIDTKVGQWIDDDRMKNFIRPSTLFGNKFDDYLQEEKPITEKELEQMLINLTKPKREYLEGEC